MHFFSEDSANCSCHFQVNVMTATQLQVLYVKSNIDSEFPIFLPPNQIEDQQYKENFSERGGSHYVIADDTPNLSRTIPIAFSESRAQFSSTISLNLCSIWLKEGALRIQEIQAPPGLQVELTVFK